MRLLLACLGGVALLAGCASVPQQAEQSGRVATSFPQFDTDCDYRQMERIENVKQPYLLGRYWVNCPQKRNPSNPS